MGCCTGHCGCGNHHGHGASAGQEEATQLKVSGMSCQHCVMSIKKSVDVDLKTGQVTVTHTPGQPSRETIQEAIRDAGYQPEV